MQKSTPERDRENPGPSSLSEALSTPTTTRSRPSSFASSLFPSNSSCFPDSPPPSNACDFTSAKSDSTSTDCVSSHVPLLPLASLQWGGVLPYACVEICKNMQSGVLVLTRRFCVGSVEKTLPSSSNTFPIAPHTTATVPFTPAWLKACQKVPSIRHVNLYPIKELLFNLETREVCIVHPMYKNGVSPLAFLLEPYCKRNEAELSTLCAFRVLCGIGDALVHLHRNGHVHGELSPWAVLLDQKENVFLIWSGLAAKTLTGGESPHTAKEDIDMWRFTAPELRGKNWLSAATILGDTYAFGALVSLLLPQHFALRDALRDLTRREPRSRMSLTVFVEILRMLWKELTSQESKTSGILCRIASSKLARPTGLSRSQTSRRNKRRVRRVTLESNPTHPSASAPTSILTGQKDGSQILEPVESLRSSPKVKRVRLLPVSIAMFFMAVLRRLEYQKRTDALMEMMVLCKRKSPPRLPPCKPPNLRQKKQKQQEKQQTIRREG